jgi:hypothetical protein
MIRRPVLLWLLLALPAHAAAPAAQVFETAAPSVFSVGVIGTDGQRRSGSGVAVAPGKIATNFHVVRDAREIFVKHGERVGKALLLSADERHDLALLHAEGFSPPVARFAPRGAAGIGQPVYAIGAPRGLDLSLSQGIVSSLRRTADGELIQTTAPISPGSSGGGLFDEQGRLLGLTTAQIVDGQNLNFAIPVEWLRFIGVNPAPTEILGAAPAPATPVAETSAPPGPLPLAEAGPAESAAAPPPPAAALPMMPEAPAQPTRIYVALGVVALLLLLTRPAIRLLADWMSRSQSVAAPTPSAPRTAVPDRLLPFRTQAREEIKNGTRDAETWLRALEQTGGDESRATVTYIELRTQALYRGDLDRKWAAAQAQGLAFPRRPGTPGAS